MKISKKERKFIEGILNRKTLVDAYNSSFRPRPDLQAETRARLLLQRESLRSLLPSETPAHLLSREMLDSCVKMLYESVKNEKKTMSKAKAVEVLANLAGWDGQYGIQPLFIDTTSVKTYVDSVKNHASNRTISIDEIKAHVEIIKSADVARLQDEIDKFLSESKEDEKEKANEILDMYDQRKKLKE